MRLNIRSENNDSLNSLAILTGVLVPERRDDLR